MEKLSQTTFDHLRSWLGFEELHKFRRVSKAWENVENVDKVVTLGNGPSTAANVDRITHLMIESLQGTFVEIRTIEELLLKNKSCLQYLKIDFNYCCLGKAFKYIRIPPLPYVKKLTMLCDDEDEGMKLFCQKMIQAMPRLEILEIPSIYDYKIVDFNDMKEVKTIEINKNLGTAVERDGYQLKNAHLGKLQEVRIYSSYSEEIDDSILPIWISAFPNITFSFRFDFKLGRNFKIKECVWTKNNLRVKRIVASIDNFPVRDIATALKNLVQRFEAIRAGPLEVSYEIDSSWTKTNELAFILVLAKMKEL